MRRNQYWLLFLIDLIAGAEQMKVKPLPRDYRHHSTVAPSTNKDEDDSESDYVDDEQIVGKNAENDTAENSTTTTSTVQSKIVII